MRLIVLDELVINLDLVAYAERRAGSVVLHFAVPIAVAVPGVTYSMGASPPTASDHVQLIIEGEYAIRLWAEMTAECS